MRSTHLAEGACALVLLPSLVAAHAAAPQSETVIVTGTPSQTEVASHIESIDAATAKVKINVVNTEDMLKYLPSITIRKRHIGDTQDPIATRTNGVGASARSLIFADGILISSPIGNNNSGASPHFAIAQPQDVTGIEVLYGPFAAEYGGGSIGAVVNIRTKMPDRFVVYAGVTGSLQPFAQYGTSHDYGTWQVSAGVGDHIGAFSFRLSANHLDATSQPLSYVTLARPSNPSSAGMPLRGGFNDLSRTGAPILVAGASGIEAQCQDTSTLKMAYDFTEDWQATYTVSVFHQGDTAKAESYLRNSAGDMVYAGSSNIGGYAYSIGASVFSNGVWHWNQTHLAQGLTLATAADRAWSWEFVASDYAYLSDNQRIPGTALPSAATGGAGTITRLDGTGWYTLDAKGIWRGWAEHTLSFGLHHDAEAFSQTKFATANWITAAPGSITAKAQGRTATEAVWLQDIWAFAENWNAIAGLRLEGWRAYDAINISATPPLNVNQPRLSARVLSPKLSVQWEPAHALRLSASWGLAQRMPTVTELYQTITTGPTLTVPNPNLKPERALSYELAGEYHTDQTRLRLALFREDIANALLSQSALLVPGSTTLYSYVQNVDRTRVQGIEVVAESKGFVIENLDISGSLTYADAKTVKDLAFAAAAGKRLPQIPKLKATALATYHVGEALSLSLAGRYADRSFGTIDSSDSNAHTFTGFDGYLVLDMRANYRIDEHWSIAAGIDNLNERRYFLYHPFPQRSFQMELHYAQ
ncbi:iron complex outermembrane receptor protein [Rhizomicrobium palustre]|uniref:Iron complex outermembrane receptor protein n=1 Tax=Rhizomicrobium palustre TaxID=189966 RepID=A0A846N1X9_9PROT|nr:TonB-dependent receptor [Rhizomicrobium palustre]NIK89746.1 iron complex outermembrane receptor protein [Rhizomicrobium palustre]